MNKGDKVMLLDEQGNDTGIIGEMATSWHTGTLVIFYFSLFNETVHVAPKYLRKIGQDYTGEICDTDSVTYRSRGKGPYTASGLKFKKRVFQHTVTILKIRRRKEGPLEVIWRRDP